jgi:hypothetical protein
VQPHVADHHQISDETLAARIRSTCLTRTVPHKICAAARNNVPLFTESKSTRNPTTVVSDPSHNPHKHYCQIKMGKVKCRTLYICFLFETFLNPGQTVQLAHYVCHGTDRLTASGGTAVLVRRGIVHQSVSVSGLTHLEATAIQVILAGKPVKNLAA